MPGWPGGEYRSWGYHGDDGGIFMGQGEWSVQYDKYGKGDTVGCGLDQQRQIFFTKNGTYLGKA